MPVDVAKSLQSKCEFRQRLAARPIEEKLAMLDAWRKELDRDFERALAETKLPERPDDEAANRFPIIARLGIAFR